jgi:hypothetical protein
MNDDLTGLVSCIDVSPKDQRNTIKDATPDHLWRAGPEFLSWLEDQPDRSVTVRVSRQECCCADQHRNMGVMAARVHHSVRAG